MEIENFRDLTIEISRAEKKFKKNFTTSTKILILGTDIQRSFFDSSKVDEDRTTPPQFFLPGSLTPADVTKWGSGCWKHCWEGFSGRCKLCGSTACR